MSAPAVDASRIRVERSESPASPGQIEELLGKLDTQPGMWMGCDVEAEGLYERQSMGCANPSLGFFLDGNELKVLAYTPVGHALLTHVQVFASFTRGPGSLSVRYEDAGPSPHPVIRLLRAFLALFDAPYPELALFGAFSFDYGRLASGDALPDDGKRRMALYFPEQVLVSGNARSSWVSFRFPGLKISAASVPAALEPVHLEREVDDLVPGEHAMRVRQGVARLRQGEVYALVLSQTFRRRVSVASSAAFGELRKLNPYPAMFFLNLGGGETLFGASPDIQVRANAEFVESAPVCGTYRRGTDPVADADQALALLNSGKEDAALAACADSDRNDKATVCVPGSLELVSRRRVHFFSTIIHTIDHTRGRRRVDADVFDVLLAHASPATVTGMPKPAAVRAIEEIESSWRGWYAGAVARLAADGSMEALTVLRAARVVGDLAEVRTGGNLLVDSDPEKEEEETHLKAETLFRVLSGVSPLPASLIPSINRPFNVSYFDGGDPIGPLFADCLAGLGCDFVHDDVADITILGDGKHEHIERWATALRPMLALGAAALALLEADGGVATTLAEPRYARRIDARVQGTGFLNGCGPLELGVYSRQVIERKALPTRWRAAAVSSEDWVLVAWAVDRPHIALLCRPDSVQSMKGDAGRRLVRAALSWLADWKFRK